MRFGPTPLRDAAGAVLAHTLRVGDEVLKKGRRLSPEDVIRLESLGITSVVCARLDPGDVGEDDAAAAIARAIAGDGVWVTEPFTGRANLHAGGRGVVDFEPAAIDRLNGVGEEIAVSTVALHAPVESGQMVCTVKIIPFAVDRMLLERALVTDATVSVHGWAFARAGMISTRLPGVRESVIDRAVKNMRVRLERLGGGLEIERRLPHEEHAIAGAIRELVERGCSPILILGASAIVDRGDVVPRSVVAAGGEILRLGMPVDPGNLLLLARIGEVPLLGVPGCARSLARSGFDQVLERLLAGIDIDSTALSRMGSGGLLGEIATRPQPRAAPRRARRIAAVVLAAGESRRMEGENKLLMELDGRAIVSWVVETVRGAGVRDIFVVVGHQADEVRRAVADAGVTFVDNEVYATGMASSLRAGIATLPEDVDAALVCLGDMPRVTSPDIRSVIDAFDPAMKREICIPTHDGKRGHPVVFAARFLPEIEALEGDVGARSVIERHAALVHLVPVDHPGVLLDVDTPEALRSLSRG